MNLFNEEELNLIIDKRISENFNRFSNGIVREKLNKYIQDELDWECADNKIKWKMEKIIEEKVTELLPQINDKYIDELSEKIAKELAWNISKLIEEKFYYLLKTKFEEDED